MALLLARPGLVLPALRPLTVSAQLLLELDELMEEVDPKGATEAVDGPTTDAAVEGLETPVRFSTAVQTVAPSTIATLRQNSTYMASIRSRSVSLV